MATQYAFGKIVTDGLVLALDAADKNSYPGSGTTLYDVSGNGNHGTLYNGVGFSNANGGVLTFDGVDDYVQSLTPNLSATNYTVIGAARYSNATPNTRGRMINGGSTPSNWLLGHWENSVASYYADGWVTSAGAGGSDTNWRIYTGTGDISGDSYNFYINNILNTGPSSGGVAGPVGISIGAQTYSGVSEYSTGHFSFVLVYNRVLTPAEILQNYNAKKSRFNL
jgi:hypothetical protein